LFVVDLIKKGQEG